MKRKIMSIIVAVCMLVSLCTTAFANYDPTGYGYNNYNNGYYGSYSGENYYNYNYGSGYYGSYYMSSWTQELQAAYEPTWYESPQRQVARGEAFLLFLRAVQRSLDRQGYSRLMAGYMNVPFSDYYTVNTYAQSEVNVLYANGILVGYPDGTMKFSQLLTRAEMAAIYSRFNRIYFNMGMGYSQWNYNGYNNYYNNNYNNYYNGYMYSDINGHWAAQDILTASANGVLNGLGYNVFQPEGPLTIEQIWKILDCCAGYQGLRRSDIAYAMSQTFKVKFGKHIDESVGTANGTKITRITSSTSTLSISEGETRNIKVTIYPTDAEYQKLNWTSSNTNYVSVEESWNSSKGTAYVTIYGRRANSSYITLTGRAMDGSGTIVTIKVRVNSSNNNYYDDDEYITSITPSENILYLNVGQSKEINARILPLSADYKNLNWTSSNSNVAYVSNVRLSGSYSYGTITAANEGTSYIYIKAQDGSGQQATVKVIVSGNNNSNSVITSATASPSYVNLNVGSNQNVVITSYPINATDKNITWTSDNQNIAAVYKVSNTSIRITGVGIGTTNIRGIASATGNEVCVIPVTVSNNQVIVPNPGTNDTTAPIVTLEGANNVKIGETIAIVAKAYDESGIASFNIDVSSIIGMTGSLSPSRVEKISNTEYRITLMGVEVASQCICVVRGAAVDTSGNLSEESNEIVIFINSGEEWSLSKRRLVKTSRLFLYEIHIIIWGVLIGNNKNNSTIFYIWYIK